MSHHQSLVSAEWLKDNLDNPNVKIIDCRFRLPDANWGYQHYSHSHIKNAYYLHLNNDLSGNVTTHGGRHPLPDCQLLATKFEGMGIVKNTTKVVVYDDSRFAFSARLWWLLRYLGHQNVSLLNGGWQGWQTLDYPCDNVIPPSSQGHFIPTPKADWLVDKVTVEKAQSLAHIGIIDARAPERYRGEIEPIDPIAGSIPTALNLFWQENSTAEGFLKSPAELAQIWQPYQSYQELILYCGSGVTACVNFFVLEQLGYDNCRLYAGGWSDWCSYLVPPSSTVTC